MFETWCKTGDRSAPLVWLTLSRQCSLACHNLQHQKRTQEQQPQTVCRCPTEIACSNDKYLLGPKLQLLHAHWVPAGVQEHQRLQQHHPQCHALDRKPKSCLCGNFVSSRSRPVQGTRRGACVPLLWLQEEQDGRALTSGESTRQTIRGSKPAPARGSGAGRWRPAAAAASAWGCSGTSQPAAPRLKGKADDIMRRHAGHVRWYKRQKQTCADALSIACQQP